MDAGSQNELLRCDTEDFPKLAMKLAGRNREFLRKLLYRQDVSGILADKIDRFRSGGMLEADSGLRRNAPRKSDNAKHVPTLGHNGVFRCRKPFQVADPIEKHLETIDDWKFVLQGFPVALAEEIGDLFGIAVEVCGADDGLPVGETEALDQRLVGILKSALFVLYEKVQVGQVLKQIKERHDQRMLQQGIHRS